MKMQHTEQGWAVRRLFAGMASSRLRPDTSPASAGFSLIETVVVMALVGMLIAAGLSTLTLLDRSSRRQALHTTALELAQSSIEDLLTNPYSPPTAPFLATTNTIKTAVILALAKNSTNVLVGGTMTTVIAPAAQGHLVTVTVTTTNANQLLSAQLQTVINEKSGSQP